MEKKDEAFSTDDDEPKLNYRGWKAMPYVIGNETFERLGTTGAGSNLLVYFTTVFNMKSITATTFVNVFNGTTNFAALPGAFCSDTYFGRYKTLGFTSVATFLGLLVLTLTAGVSKLHPPHCASQDTETCPGPTPWQMTFLLSGLGLLVIGAAGIRSCNLAFGADQFNSKTESGKTGINSFFNWYYFNFTFAMMVSLTIIVYVQSNVSWTWGLAIPAIMMFFSCATFFWGTKLYVIVKPNGSPFTSMIQVVAAAIKKRKLGLPEQPWLSLYNHIPKGSINSKLSYTDQFRFLSKASIIAPEDQMNSDGSPVDPWRLCSMQKVEELKCLIRVMPVWIALVVFFITIIQQQTYVVFQALQSDRRLGNTSFKIPAASYTVFIMVAIIIWIPVYDRILVPWLQKLTKKEGGITILQRLGVGLVLSVITMLLSAIVERKRRALAITNPIGVDDKRGDISSLSGFWLIPQLTLMGLADGFTVLGQIEFYYQQFPENLRSLAGSLTYVGIASSNYLSSLLISIVHKVTEGAGAKQWLPEDLNKGRLDYFYYLVAALGIINFGYFLLCAKWYKYKGTGGNAPEVGMENLQCGQASGGEREII